MKCTYSGATSGVGAKYAWDDNKNIGSGSMEIIDSSPNKITMKLDFTTPMVAHNIVEFSLMPNGGSTTVTQVMSGPSPYISKLMSLVFRMDKWLALSLKKVSLKASAEK
jgi:hypothetical protein